MAKIDEQPPEHSPAVRVIAMPADTNPHGDIFGGWLMSLMIRLRVRLRRATATAVR